MLNAPGMVSMEYDDEDKLDAVQPMPMSSKPDFPPGLRIILTDKELAKLKCDASDAEVGGMFHGCFEARITSVNCSAGEMGPCCRIEAQIESLHVPKIEDD